MSISNHRRAEWDAMQDEEVLSVEEINALEDLLSQVNRTNNANPSYKPKDLPKIDIQSPKKGSSHVRHHGNVAKPAGAGGLLSPSSKVHGHRPRHGTKGHSHKGHGHKGHIHKGHSHNVHDATVPSAKVPSTKVPGHGAKSQHAKEETADASKLEQSSSPHDIKDHSSTGVHYDKRATYYYDRDKDYSADISTQTDMPEWYKDAIDELSHLDHMNTIPPEHDGHLKMSDLFTSKNYYMTDKSSPPNLGEVENEKQPATTQTEKSFSEHVQDNYTPYRPRDSSEMPVGQAVAGNYKTIAGCKRLFNSTITQHAPYNMGATLSRDDKDHYRRVVARQIDHYRDFFVNRPIHERTRRQKRIYVDPRPLIRRNNINDFFRDDTIRGEVQYSSSESSEDSYDDLNISGHNSSGNTERLSSGKRTDGNRAGELRSAHDMQNRDITKQKRQNRSTHSRLYRDFMLTDRAREKRNAADFSKREQTKQNEKVDKTDTMRERRYSKDTLRENTDAIDKAMERSDSNDTVTENRGTNKHSLLLERVPSREGQERKHCREKAKRYIDSAHDKPQKLDTDRQCKRVRQALHPSRDYPQYVRQEPSDAPITISDRIKGFMNSLTRSIVPRRLARSLRHERLKWNRHCDKAHRGRPTRREYALYDDWSPPRGYESRTHWPRSRSDRTVGYRHADSPLEPEESSPDWRYPYVHRQKELARMTKPKKYKERHGIKLLVADRH